MTSNYEPQEIQLSVPWGYIAARAWGSSKDQPVLVVHGLLDNAGSFDRLIPLLPRGYYFVCVDLPGHGLSSHFPAGMPLKFLDYVLTLRRIIDTLGWETCIYLGHSLGAQLGLCCAVIYPTIFEKIVCLDALTPLPVSNEKLLDYIYLKNEHTLNAETKKIERLYTHSEVMYTLLNMRFHGLNTAAAEALMKRAVTKVGEKYKFNRDLRLGVGLRDLLNLDQMATLYKRVETPTLVIFATAYSSLSRAEDLRTLCSQITLNKNYSFDLVQGNHDAHNNHPERVAPLIITFLNNLKSSL